MSTVGRAFRRRLLRRARQDHHELPAQLGRHQLIAQGVAGQADSEKEFQRSRGPALCLCPLACASREGTMGTATRLRCALLRHSISLSSWADAFFV